MDSTTEKKKIDKLTDAQIALQSVYRDEGIKIGTRPGPTNRDVVDTLMPQVYRDIGANTVPEIVYVRSPEEGVQWLLNYAADNGVALTRADILDNAVYGYNDIYWLQFYWYWRNVCGLVEETEAIVALRQMVEHCGWFFPYENVVVMCDRHINPTLNVDARGLTHCTTGPAIEFADGFKIYQMHRIDINPEYIENPASLTPAKIDAEPNVEVRRCLMELYGHVRYLEDSGAKLVHADSFGELYVKEMPDDEPLTMVKVTNSTPEPDGTFKNYYLPVHPELRPLLPKGQFGEPQAMTARNAVASTFGLKGEDYAPEVET